MTGLKARWLARIDKILAKQNTAASDIAIALPASPEMSPGNDCDREVADESTGELPPTLPIYTATTQQLNRWHASGCNLFLQNLLREYDLDFSSYNLHAYDEFKIGFDDDRHVATFAVDETHYYIIRFNERNSAPANRDDAESVLAEIQRLRILRAID